MKTETCLKFTFVQNTLWSQYFASTSLKLVFSNVNSLVGFTEMLRGKIYLFDAKNLNLCTNG